MNLKLLNELAASNDRSFKFTALGASFAFREGRMEGRFPTNLCSTCRTALSRPYRYIVVTMLTMVEGEA